MTKIKDTSEFTPEERAAARDLIRQNRWKWRAISVVWILFAAFVIYAYLQNQARAKEGQRAFHVQCVAKANTREELADSKQYLHDHPKGTRDIPLNLILASIKRQEATLKNLQSLQCPQDRKGGDKK